MNDKPNNQPQDQDADDLNADDQHANDPTTPMSQDEIDVTRDLNEVQSDFISQPSDAIFGAQGAGPPQQVGDVLQIGPYALIGSPAPSGPGGSKKHYVEGGEGRVYLAQHIGDKTTVVLKTPLPQYASDPVRCARLIREAEQLQSMKHRSIVKILDISPDSDPPFYTMQHLSGGELASQMKKGQPMPKDQVLRIAAPLADAVRYVNEELGISHRDIKPSNVMLDEQGNPFFIDFGLSRDVTGDERSITDHRSDSTNRFKVGTARYMAPELFDGKAGNAQTDIYAFGIMLYEMATGGRPYHAPDYPTIDKMKRLVDPDTPMKVYPEIDPGLAAVIEHAVARRPKDRYTTMEDLHEDLEMLIAGGDLMHATPIASGSDIDQSMVPAAQPRKKSKAGMLVTTVLLLGAIGGGIAYAVTMGDDGVKVVKKDKDDKNDAWGEEDKGEPVVDPIDGPIDEPVVDPVDPPTPHPSIALIEDIDTEFADQEKGKKDPVIAKKIVGLTSELHEPPTTSEQSAYSKWLDDAAKSGMPQTLATLINNADAFGTTANAPVDGKLTWLQKAVASENTAAFAQQFPKWIEANKIDHAILTTAETEDEKPLNLAKAKNQTEWVKALEDLLGPPKGPIAEMIKDIEAEFAANDKGAKDAAIAKQIVELAQKLSDQPGTQARDNFGAWLHDAAKTGMPQTLATLIKNAGAFGATPNALDAAKRTWLQSAVTSPDNAGFAIEFPQWIEANKIDHAILTTAKFGTPKPLDIAKANNRTEWINALEPLVDNKAEPIVIPPQDATAVLMSDLNTEFAANDKGAKDAAIARQLGELVKELPEKPGAQMRDTFGQWLHDAAKTGMPQTLATLIKNADAFGATPNTLDAGGHTWLQTAVTSPDNANFANAFPQWLKANKIDRSILTAAKLGTRNPLARAELLERAEWVKALKAALATE